MIYRIEDVLEDIKNGIPIIIVDNEDRENEGDIFFAAEKATYDAVNFMAKKARGLTCVPMSREYAEKLNLDPMVSKNTDQKGTAFTVSVDAKEGTTTGISINDRLITIKKLSYKNSTSNDFTKPGHIFPLISKDRGVLEREGHTEATVDLCKICGLAPVSVICEILNDDGTMARMKDLELFSKKYNLKMITIEDLVKYRKKNEELIKIDIVSNLPTSQGNFKIIAFKNYIDDKEHIALVKGDIFGKENVMVRIHSECFTGDILGSMKCDCGSQLKFAMDKINKNGEGIILYLRQEGRGIGLLNKLKAYNLQEEGMDTLEANLKLGFKGDEREYAIASQMLKAFNIKSVNLLTNNPLKIEGLEEYGIKVLNREEIEVEHNDINKKYLETKKEKMGHLLKLK